MIVLPAGSRHSKMMQELFNLCLLYIGFPKEKFLWCYYLSSTNETHNGKAELSSVPENQNILVRCVAVIDNAQTTSTRTYLQHAGTRPDLGDF